MACDKVKQGVLQPQPPVAGLRYVNLITDTAAVDFVIVNFVGDAPITRQAAFRTGGLPFGVSTNFLPPHWPVEANRDVQIRVFMNSIDPAVASLVLLDTTCTFAPNVNYTFFSYGTARSVGGVHAFVTADTVPASVATTGVAFRVANLGGAAVGAVDVDVVTQATVAPLTGTATYPSVAPGTVTSYLSRATNAALKAVTSVAGSRTPIVLTANAPAGVVVDTVLRVNPVAGTLVANTAITALIVPRPVAGSRAQTGCPTACAASDTLPRVLFLIDRKPNAVY